MAYKNSLKPRHSSTPARYSVAGRALWPSPPPSPTTSSSYADSNGTTIKDGCCACGGGAGGPPSVLLRGKNIKNCNQVPGALGFGGAYGGYAASACYGAYMPSANTNLNLYKL